MVIRAILTALGSAAPPNFAVGGPRPLGLRVAVRGLGEPVAEHDLARAAAVDVAHHALVEPVAEQLEQPVRERRRDLGRDAR